MASLYLQYRPVTFDDVVDQDVPKRALKNAVAAGQVSHAYLFCGSRGTGKTSTARILAKALVCDSPTAEGNPCLTCPCCVQAGDGSLVDIIEIDAASNRGIDEIRALKERISFAPTRAQKKVYIIDEVHMLTKDAFNALLKTLEEPPSHVHFILATTEAHKVLDTIISRCQRYDFLRISHGAIVERLAYISAQEGFVFDTSALEAVASAANGGLRDAIRTLEQLSHSGFTTTEEVYRFLGAAGVSRVGLLVDHLESGALQKALLVVQECYGSGVQATVLIKEVLGELRSRMMLAVENGSLSRAHTLIAYIDHWTHARQQLAWTIIETLPLEVACIRCTSGGQERPVSAPAKQPAVQEPMVIPPAAQPVAVPRRAPEPVIKQPAVTPPLPSLPQEEVVSATMLHELFATPAVLPKEEAAPTSATTVEGDLPSLEVVQQEWAQVCNRITKSSIKFCLREGRPVSLEGQRLIVRFPTRFSADKVMETAHRDMVHTAVREHFHVPLDVEASVQGGTEDGLPQASTPTEDVLSIFGGMPL